MDILDRSAVVVSDFAAFGVGFAQREAATEIASGERQAKSVGPMVAAGGRIQIRCPAKLASANNNRILQAVTKFQVFDQRRKGRIQLAHKTALQFMIIDVRVPTVQGYFDTANSLFDEPQRGQASVAKIGTTEIGASRDRLGRQIKRFQLVGGHHFDRPGNQGSIRPAC